MPHTNPMQPAHMTGKFDRAARRQALRSFDRRFYFWAWALAATILFAGFSRSFFLRPLFKHSGLVLLLHVHGFVMTSWFALFLLQISLVATGRVKLHQRIGLIGPVLAAIAWMVGGMVLTRAVLRHAGFGDPSFFRLLVAFDGLNLTVFAGLVASAFLFRRRPDYHKRLMLLATISLLPPAAGRITEIYGPHDALAVVVFMLGCVIIAVIVDALRYRRLHPAFTLGGMIVIASNLITFAAGA